MEWTVSAVKETLPSVTVRIGKRTLAARLSGRKNEFATVSLTNSEPTFPRFMDWHFAWETIVRSLNTGKPLTL